MSKKGYKQTKEHRKKIGKAHKGKKLSQKTKEKLSAYNKKMGVIPPSRKGIHHTKRTKEKISNTLKGKLIGGNSSAWKGGKTKVQGRWYIWKPEHPFVNSGGYVFRYRLVAEKCLGRYLTKKEIIHHLNEITDDDRPENLYLFSSQSEHIKFHRSKNKPILKANLNK